MTYSALDFVWLRSGSEQMRLDSTGLGIGTSSPSGQLSLGTNGSTQVGSQILLYDAGSASNANNYGLAVNASTGEFSASAGTSGYFTFYTLNRTERMRLDSSGNLGIGTSSPAVKLDVKGDTDTHVGITAIATDEAIIVAFDDGGIRTPNLSYAANSHKFLIDTTERMTLDSSGNLGLGVTPSAWGSVIKPIEINRAGNFVGAPSNAAAIHLGANVRFDGDWKYANTEAANLYTVENNVFMWRIAPSGTAGNTISFTQAMTLDASGNLGVGTTSPADAQLTTVVSVNAASGYCGFRVLSNGTAVGRIVGSSGNEFRIDSLSTNPLTFYTNGSERARITSAGGLVVGPAALATAATDGFLYVPTCAGTPTGTPTTQTGTAPIVVDTTNNKLYFYSGGQWRDAGP
jgi:hypothetical protein